VRLAVTFFACITIAAGALMPGDYSRPPAETSRGLQLGRLGLENDYWSIEQMRPQVTAIGYASARNVLGPVRLATLQIARPFAADR
jgi:hypothetical protein